MTLSGSRHVLEPSTPFVDGLHIQAICLHLQAITEGRLAHLIINVPPGHAKSLLTAVFWPAWVVDRATAYTVAVRQLFGQLKRTRQRQVPAFDRIRLVSTALGRPLPTQGRPESEEPA
jgi:hypothetical protein